MTLLTPDQFQPLEAPPPPCAPVASRALAQNLCRPWPDSGSCSVPPQTAQTGQVSPIYQTGRVIPTPAPAGVPLLSAIGRYTIVLRVTNMSAGQINVSRTNVHQGIQGFVERSASLWTFFGPPDWNAESIEMRYRFVAVPGEARLDHLSTTSPPAFGAPHTETALAALVSPNVGSTIDGLMSVFDVTTDHIVSGVEMELTNVSGVGPVEVEIYEGNFVTPANDPPSLTLIASAALPASSLGGLVTFNF